MAAAILNSQRAVDVSIYVVRAFVQMREVVSSHQHYISTEQCGIHSIFYMHSLLTPAEWCCIHNIIVH